MTLLEIKLFNRLCKANIAARISLQPDDSVNVETYRNLVHAVKLAKFYVPKGCIVTEVNPTTINVKDNHNDL